MQTVTDLVQCKLLVLMDKIAKEDMVIDLQEVLLRFTFDNICTAAFGVDPGCLDVSLPEVEFARAFEEATELTLFRFTVPPFVWKIMKAFNVGSEKKLKLAIKTVHEFAERTVLNRRAELHKLSERCDLLSRLMEVGSYSDKFLKDFCISFILAGRDTSSVALAWFFWLLNENPHVENRILEELSSIKDDASDACTVADLKRMEYLQAAISESLRLYPSVPIDFKEVQEDDTFPDGTKVKKGARVIYSIYSMARNEEIWGKDCREFKPERWLKDGIFVSENQFKYAVFNAGPRLCIGKKFAYMQMKMVVSSILRKYHVHVVNDQEVVPKLNTTLYLKNGLKVTVKARAEIEV